MDIETTAQPLWYREPRRDAGSREWDLWRPEGTKKQTVIIASHDVIGTMVHYANGRTRQCERENCTSCKTGNKAREKGYVAAQHAQTNKKLIVELVPSVFEALRDAYDQYRTLRGVLLTLWRTGKALNAPVAYELKPANEFTKKITLAPPVIPIVTTIWGHTSASVEERRLIIAAELAALEQQQTTETPRRTGTDDKILD